MWCAAKEHRKGNMMPENTERGMALPENTERDVMRCQTMQLIDSCITQLKAQGPSRTCNESKEEAEEEVWEGWAPGGMSCKTRVYPIEALLLLYSRYRSYQVLEP